MQGWTREFALNYMTAHSNDFYLNKLQHRFDAFDIKRRCKNQFRAFIRIKTVCDIGAGVMGGALALFPYGKERTVIDALADEYNKIGKLPVKITTLQNDFANIHLEDNSQDIIFCWEVFDHALTEKHFIDGQKELIRILKPGGLLFFYIPLRNKPKPGHVIIRTEKQIMEVFSELELKWTKIESEWQRYENGLYVVFTKKAEFPEKDIVD